MTYRYYLHDDVENVGVTEFSSDNCNMFVECLIDCINWITYETDNERDTLNYTFFVFNGERRYLVTFSIDDNGDLVVYFAIGDKVNVVSRDSVNDYIKSHF